MPAQQTYPFTAIVGSDDLRLALILSAISPPIGGVLVRGEKGTAKSTAARALAAVLPAWDDGTRPRLVELPVGATEDRVLGSLHLEQVLTDGTTEYEPGLLVQADRGLLYVDEVNLLPDHLVDVLLDAAAMGRCTVERDGVSVTRAARFVLIGTMNPEEGELRPQLLDRFGLTVEVAAPRDPATRAEVVRRRLRFDADPDAFVREFAAEERDLASRLRAAQQLLPAVELTEATLLRIAEICAGFDVDGLRADLVMARTAVALTAWNGRSEITHDDLRVAARLALPHRRRRQPFDAPGLDESLLDDLLGPDGTGPDRPDPDDEPDGPVSGQPGAPSSQPGTGSGSEMPSESRRGGSPEHQPEATSGDAASRAQDPFRARLLTVTGLGKGSQGRRSAARTASGRRVGTRPLVGGSLDLLGTVHAALPHQLDRGRRTGPLRLIRTDLRTAIRRGQESNLVLFCVDASGSMAARRRMEQVKTAILSLLLDAYRRRDTVGLVTFRNQQAEVALPPTRSVDVAARRLDELATGGRTPLAEGLIQAHQVLARELRRDPLRRPFLVVVTDGRATAGTDAVTRSRQAAAAIAAASIACVVIDCESGAMRLGLARELAAFAGAEHLPVDQVDAATLAGAVRERVA